MKILLVEDDLEISKLLAEFLQENGYEVFCQYDGLHVLDCLRENNIDLILLDIMLPYRNGDTVLTAVRECSTVPIIVISAKGTTQNKIDLLRLGADDYITKPFSMKILSRKIDVILKRTVLVSQLIFEDGYLSIDMDNVKVSVKGRECSVTPTECRLLRQFLLNRGQLLTYDLLLERLWDSGSQFVDRHALAVNINRLRGKIEDETHKYISNVYGMGYQWIG